MRLKDFAFKKEELQYIIKNHSKYFAHLSKDEKIKETLIEHTLLVQEYFFTLIKKNNLESIIFNLIKNLTSKENLQEKIADIFVKSIAIHDFGKVNPKFQKEKMKNDNIKDIDHKLSSSHSLISAYIYVLYSELLFKNISKEDEIFIDVITLAFSYPILMHHSPYIDRIDEVEKYKENADDLKKFITNFLCFDNEKDFIKLIDDYVISNTNIILENINETIKNEFTLFLLVKLLYSLLTAADYYATTHFMNNWEQLDDNFGILDNNLKKKIVTNIKITKGYNSKIYNELDTYKIKFPKDQSNTNLNKLRQSIATEVIRNLGNNFDKNIFYIEAPTGSGKTNLSMLVLSELLKNDVDTGKHEVNKVFYVFPFITLITQTYQSLKETLGLTESEIVQIHSKSGLINKEDDNYGFESKVVIDYLFMNYPISLISHIKFFDILKSNRKSSNYLLHRLANSIIIIDELQAYSPKEWDKIVYFIANYSEVFNIKFILMSATLPKIDNLLLPFEKIERNNEFVSLVKNKDKYFKNPNFKNRVTFNYELLDWENKDRKEYLEKLWNRILKESEEYKNIYGRVHTIIEFIYNKTAGEFAQLVKNNSQKNNFFDEVFLLSGTILEPRRKEIIAKLKSANYSKKNILLITTQVVEAGIDIDMDIGFKDISLVDSDEQLAGRINRNVNKENCKLFLFNLDKAGTIYGKDYRYKLLNDFNKHKEILESKNFDELYKIVMNHKNEINKSTDYINIKDYLKQLKNLNFSSVNKDFTLIEGVTITIFVPIHIPIEIPESNEKNFSQEEIEFLEENNALVDEKVSGQKVWEIYCGIIENKDNDFFSSKKQQIIIQGIISKFVFSVMIKSENYNKLIKSGNCEEKYGFLFLHNVNEIYSYEWGILTYKESNFTFL